MQGQRPQPELLRQVRDVGAVDAAAEAQDAVVGPLSPLPLDLRDRRGEHLVTKWRGEDRLCNPLLVFMAAVAHPLLVEDDLRVAAVHDAAGADAVRPLL